MKIALDRFQNAFDATLTLANESEKYVLLALLERLRSYAAEKGFLKDGMTYDIDSGDLCEMITAARNLAIDADHESLLLRLQTELLTKRNELKACVG